MPGPGEGSAVSCLMNALFAGSEAARELAGCKL
jgi:hypothetical protein